jgi:hypothetical protein
MRSENRSIAFGLIIIISLFYSCNETIVPSEKFFKQDSDWQLFAPEYYDYVGISYNLDNNYTKLKFKTKLGNYSDYFDHVDSVASIKGWRINKISDLIKVYRKKSNNYPNAEFNDMITIEFDTLKKEIQFYYKPEYE